MSAETTAITSTTALQSTIDTMKREAGALVVRDANDYAAVAQFLIRIRAVKKQIGYLLDPGIQSATAHLNELREGRARYTRQIDELDATASKPAEDWKRREREAAQAEERRINEERRVAAAAQAEADRKAAEAQAETDRKKREAEIKAAQKSGDMGKREGERLKKEAEERERKAKEQAARDAEAAKANVQEVKVTPSTPKVAGIRGRVNYYAEVVDANKLINAFVDAAAKHDGLRASYLRRFIMVNAQELGAEARDVKNSDKLNATIPGVKFTDKDAI